jgi:tRNA(Ile2) C34 agmatinyltransferase TiaS
MGFYYVGTVIFVLLAVIVVVVGVRQFNRPKCPSCGLSVARGQAKCPYCHASMHR